MKQKIAAAKFPPDAWHPPPAESGPGRARANEWPAAGPLRSRSGFPSSCARSQPARRAFRGLPSMAPMRSAEGFDAARTHRAMTPRPPVARRRIFPRPVSPGVRGLCRPLPDRAKRKQATARTDRGEGQPASARGLSSGLTRRERSRN